MTEEDKSTPPKRRDQPEQGDGKGNPLPPEAPPELADLKDKLDQSELAALYAFLRGGGQGPGSTINININNVQEEVHNKATFDGSHFQDRVSVVQGSAQSAGATPGLSPLAAEEMDGVLGTFMSLPSYDDIVTRMAQEKAGLVAVEGLRGSGRRTLALYLATRTALARNGAVYRADAWNLGAVLDGSLPAQVTAIIVHDVRLHGEGKSPTLDDVASWAKRHGVWFVVTRLFIDVPPVLERGVNVVRCRSFREQTDSSRILEALLGRHLRWESDHAEEVLARLADAPVSVRGLLGDLWTGPQVARFARLLIEHEREDRTFDDTVAAGRAALDAEVQEWLSGECRSLGITPFVIALSLLDGAPLEVVNAVANAIRVEGQLSPSTRGLGDSLHAAWAIIDQRELLRDYGRATIKTVRFLSPGIRRAVLRHLLYDQPQVAQGALAVLVDLITGRLNTATRIRSDAPLMLSVYAGGLADMLEVDPNEAVEALVRPLSKEASPWCHRIVAIGIGLAYFRDGVEGFRTQIENLVHHFATTSNRSLNATATQALGILIQRPSSSLARFYESLHKLVENGFNVQTADALAVSLCARVIPGDLSARASKEDVTSLQETLRHLARWTERPFEEGARVAGFAAAYLGLYEHEHATPKAGADVEPLLIAVINRSRDGARTVAALLGTVLDDDDEGIATLAERLLFLWTRAADGQPRGRSALRIGLAALCSALAELARRPSVAQRTRHLLAAWARGVNDDARPIAFARALLKVMDDPRLRDRLKQEASDA